MNVYTVNTGEWSEVNLAVENLQNPLILLAWATLFSFIFIKRRADCLAICSCIPCRALLCSRLGQTLFILFHQALYYVSFQLG